MKEFLSIAKALADANRTRMLMFLRGGELCVCRVLGVLKLAPSTVSKHLTILQQAGLVQSRKEGRWVYYRLADGSASPCVRQAIAWVHKTLADDPAAIADAKRLKLVNKTSVESLCSRYKS